jgi:serine/threonine-protein kinase
MTEVDTERRIGPGTVLDGRYEVVELLGSGGFANVYLAQHTRLGTNVALKVMHAPLAMSSDPQFSKRFEREAQVAAQMSHPNVVKVTDFGFLDSGDPYLVMEHLEGRDLEDELKEHGPLDPARLLKLMVPCIRAVGEAHKSGIVHKDLKPSNLYLVDVGTPTERLVVLDFGVARVFDDADANITQTGAFTGTPAYLPPEYIREQRVTTSFDVYQMGLILIESLTGQKAVEADGPMGYLLAHCMARLTVEPEFFDNDLGRVIKRAIAVEDEDRFADCAQLADALEDVDPAAPFEGRKHTRATSPISSDEVAAFADTITSGQLVGDSFVTGTGQNPMVGGGAAESGSLRVSADDRPTVAGMEPAGENRPLAAIAIVAVLLVLLAAGAAVMLATSSEDGAGESGAVEKVQTTAGLAVDSTEVEASAPPEVADLPELETVAEALGVASGAVTTGLEAAGVDASAAFAEARAQPAADKKADARDVARPRTAAKEVADKAAAGQKSNTNNKTDKPKETSKRLLVVD